jgi:hypothetical protein
MKALVALLSKADNRRLVETLAAAAIDFVVIGGVALAYHGVRDPFEVDDLDLLFEPSKKTAERIVPAICNLLSRKVLTETAVKPGSKLMFRSPDPFYADLIFAEETERAPEIICGAAFVPVGNITLRLASVDHLRTMKKRVVELFREELKTLKGDRRELEEKLKKHQRDLDALDLKWRQIYSS